jgi:hypothetical protein
LKIPIQANIAEKIDSMRIRRKMKKTYGNKRKIHLKVRGKKKENAQVAAYRYCTRLLSGSPGYESSQPAQKIDF